MTDSRLMRLFAVLSFTVLFAACGGGGSSPGDGGGPGGEPPGNTATEIDDADNDGIPDESDDCPNTPDGESVNQSGCSGSQLDADNDGVVDGDDDCLGTEADASVDANGCSDAQLADLDGDGVPNEDDDCADTPAGAPVDSMGCAPAGTTRGVTYDVNLPSDVDGENIAFSVHEPSALVPGETYPLILHSHGYGGSRQASRPTGGILKRFIDNGYGVLSLDERGHNDSGGTIRILDPDFEGKDWLQVLDFTEDMFDWMAFEGGNPVMGAVGGSYGGGYQLLIYAIDEEHRLDAIAPDITWNDLRYSLYSGRVFKTFWAGLLSGVGNQPNNTQDMEVNEGLLTGVSMNDLADDKLALLYRHSPASHCAGENNSTASGGLIPIDAFLSQSHLDTLFNFNDAHDNFNCLTAQGGDVRLMTKSAGHGIDNGDGGQRCGPIDRDDATFRWYEEKLKGVADAAEGIPTVCLNLGKEGDDGIVVDSVTVGGTNADLGSTTMTLQEGSQQISYVDVYTAPAGGSIIAGVPTMQLAMEDPAMGLNAVGDPVLFIGIGVQPADGGQPTAPLMNQLRPVRGFDDFDIELNGVMARLNEGDKLLVMFLAASSAQYPSSGTVPATPVVLSGDVQLPILAADTPAAAAL